jgi:hypothetical protein
VVGVVGAVPGRASAATDVCFRLLHASAAPTQDGLAGNGAAQEDGENILFIHNLCLRGI